jgi:subtilisin-like proprotein convertase family protein
MKSILILALVSGWALEVRGGETLDTSVTVNAAVPDGDPVGVSSFDTVSGLSDVIANIQVSLDITGGYNGDLFVYLMAPQGQVVVLLNRPGVSGSNPFGYDNSGFNITLTDGSANNIHDYQAVNYNLDPVTGQLTGRWAPDGRNLDPQSDGSAFDSAPETAAALGSLAGTSADGTWTLFIADLSGGGQSTLVSWGLTVVTVPEPRAWTMLGSGLLLLMWITKIKNRPNLK